MKQFEQIYKIHAPLSQVWLALTDASMAEKWGAGPARFEATEGGEFSYWDGDIHGINKKIVHEELLEQDWYGHDDPEKKFRAVFKLEPTEDGTKVTLTFSGEIVDEKKDKNDWKEYYFDPIRKLLE